MDMENKVTPEETTPPAVETTETTENAESVGSESPNLADLKPKSQLHGTVKRIELFGAFIDLGLEHDGLVHISQIREEPVKNVNEVLTIGQEVDVWVRKVDVEHGRIDLTMICPPGMLWSEIQAGQVLTGTVVRVEKFGAFIDVGAERPGMVHVSELSSGYVGSPQEVVKVGDEVQVKVLKVNSRKRQIDLSMKALETPVAAPQSAASSSASADNDDTDEKVPTAMELALRRALLMSGDTEEFPALQSVIEGADANRNAARKSGKHGKREKQRSADKRRQQQEELLSRTLSTREPGRDRNVNPAN
jgi:transcriptional accessory protein Tex/SPT6